MTVTEGQLGPNEQQVRMWAMFLHLSQFAFCLVPFAGLLAPIVIWQIKKADMPAIDEHGKAVVNWIISMIIYLVFFWWIFPLICALLGVGQIVGIAFFPLLFVLCVSCVVFPIIGGIKANNGELWRYPFSFRFIK